MYISLMIASGSSAIDTPPPLCGCNVDDVKHEIVKLQHSVSALRCSIDDVKQEILKLQHSISALYNLVDREVIRNEHPLLPVFSGRQDDSPMSTSHDTQAPDAHMDAPYHEPATQSTQVVL